MSILKFKKPDGTWESIAAIKGEPGKDGAIQYQAGEGIKIEDNVISTVNTGDEADPIFINSPASNLTEEHLSLLENVNIVPLYLSNFNLIPGNVSSAGSVSFDGSDIAEKILSHGAQNISIFVMTLGGMCTLFTYGKTTFWATYTEFIYYGTFVSSDNEIYSWTLTININKADNKHSSSKMANAGATKKISPASKFLTKTNTTEYTPTKEYHPATKKYVDDSIANIEIPESGSSENILEVDFTAMTKPDLSYPNWSDIKNSDILLNLQNLINTIKSKSSGGVRYIPIIKMNFSDGHMLFDTYTSNLYTSEPTTIEFATDAIYSGSSSTAYAVRLFTRCIGTWSDGEFTISSASFIRWSHTTIPGASTVLTKTNTTSYTPSANYHPATKKYVDDAITSAISTTLGGDY